MDIELLRTFLEITRTSHFGKAAERLNVTQSAISARIRLLEETLGAELFVRKRNNIQLTPAGKRLLKHAETIITAWQRARQDTSLTREYESSLAVGGSFDLWDILLHDWLAAVRQALPAVAIQALCDTADALLRRLLDGGLDLAFMFEPPQLPDLTVTPVAQVTLVMAASRPDLSAEQALEEGYVLVDWGTSFAVNHSRDFPRAPGPAVRAGLGAIALQFILRSGGTAYLAERVVEKYLAAGLLFLVQDAPIVERRAYAVYRSASDRAAAIHKALRSFP